MTMKYKFPNLIKEDTGTNYQVVDITCMVSVSIFAPGILMSRDFYVHMRADVLGT